MKTKTILILLFFAFLLLPFHLNHSQNKTFKLGFTGAYPQNYDYTSTSGVNWSWYGDLSMNMWSGWWIGETRPAVLDNLDNHNIDGMFEPDTIRWAGYGRQVILEAEDISDRFSYVNHHYCGDNYKDETQFGIGQLVRYYSASTPCGTAGTPMTVLDSAKENTVQSFCAFPYDPMYEIHFPLDNGGSQVVLNNYYIKPKMRINASDAFLDPPLDVAKVIVKAYNGNVVGEFVIKTFHFRDTSSTTYDGRYLEDYEGLELFVRGDIINQGRPGQWPWGLLNDCHVDYEIQWYNQVSVWIDYVIVRDQAAEKLLNPDTNVSGQVRNAIKRKINDLLNYDQGKNRMKGFYMEEVDYYNLACLKFLNDSLPIWANDIDYKVIGLVAWWSFNRTLKDNRVTDYHDYFEAVDPPFFMCAQYPFQNEGYQPVFASRLPDNLTYDLTGYPQFVQVAFNEFFGPNNTKGTVVSTTAYNNSLQNIWNAYGDSVKQMMELCDEFNKDFYLVPQVHYLMEVVNGEYYLVHKEPLNSEIEAEFCIALCHGAVGIISYAYESGYWNPTEPWTHTYGMTDFTLQDNWGHIKRTSNFYGQNKWQYVENLYGKIKIWGPVLANSTNTSGFSVHDEGAYHQYIHDIASIDPHKAGLNSCAFDSISDGGGYLWLDCPEERYWEMGFFTTTELSTKYFLMVNRRCVPEEGGLAGDDRVLRFKPNAAYLTEAVNWKLKEVGNTNDEEVIFSRSYQGYIDLGSDSTMMGWFEPGEGKLFKLEPVLKTGGNLVADEYILSGEEFTCEDTVWTNGYNLTIENGVTIHFSDSAKIVVHGGTFQIGDPEYSQTNNINIGGSTWKGFEFDTCNVKIYGVDFSGLANDSIAMLTMIDCPLIDLRNNTFALESGSNKGAIDIAYSGSYSSGVNDNVYLAYNTFSNSNTVLPYLKIMAYSGFTTPVIIESNNFTGSSTALFLSNIQGGAVKSNTISGFSSSLTALSSSVDVYNNTITSTPNGTFGINALSGTELKMSYSGGVLVGGRNNITNSGTSSYNIYLEDSYFLMDEGENIFDIGDDSYHLYGWFPESYTGAYEETENCFKVEGSVVDPPIEYVTLGEQGY